MFSQKEKRVLKYLIQRNNEFVTSQEMAEAFSCSDRTVRTYLKSIMSELQPNSGIDISSKQGYGYQLIITDRRNYQAFIKELALEGKGINTYECVEDRYNYILNQLLFEQDHLFFDDLTEELYVSRSTLSADFKKIRNDLKPYHLAIESKSNYGVYIVGDERDKRRFIMDYFFKDHFFRSLHNYVDTNFFDNQISVEELTIIVLDECREGRLKLSDFVIQNLVIHIALAIKRISEGFKISRMTHFSNGVYLKEREIASKIVNRVKTVTHLDFPSEEVDYIMVHLISKSHVLEDQRNETDILSEIRGELQEVLLNESNQENFYQDFQLIEGVATHLNTLLIRLKNNVILENPLLDEIKKRYPVIFKFTSEILKKMSFFESYVLPEDEVAYVTLHFLAAIERMKKEKKFNILVICATGYGSAQMLKNRIDNELGNFVNIVDVIGYYELSDEKLRDINFIISSIDLTNLVFNIPVFTVSIFLNGEEVKKIKEYIMALPLPDKMHEEHRGVTIKDNELIFDEYFSEKVFIVINEGTKEEIINQLVLRMGETEDECFVTKMEELIEQREKLSSVVFNSRIAVPHPIRPIASHHRIGVAIIKHGVTWESGQDEIQLVFLPSPSIYENEYLTQLTGKIVELLENETIQQQMINCETFDTFKTLFLDI